MERKQKILIIIMVVILIVVIGVSLAAYTYTRNGDENNTLITGDIYLHYTEGNTLTMTNEMPRTSYDSTRYFEFSVVGKNTYTEEDIVYEVVISHGANHATRTTRLEDKFLRFRLEEKVGNGNFTTVVAEGAYPDFANGERIWVDTIDKNTLSDVTHTYRLYVWISNEVGIGNTNIVDYDLNTWNTDVYATIKVDVMGDFTDKELETSLKDKITELKTSNVTYVKSYNTEIIPSNTGYTTQDTVGTNANKQDVLYFNGADAKTNGNVLFSGYCWQIVRTTDTGGVRLLYNGLAINNQCKTDRSSSTFKGVITAIADSMPRIDLSSETVFGKSFDYNLSTDTFTVTEVLTGKTWANNSSELIGTYTCFNGTTSCQKLYYTEYEFNPTSIYTTAYTIGNIDGYAEIGNSVYHPYVQSLAFSGYMYNKIYRVFFQNTATGTFANDVTWNGTNYVLSNNTASEFNATHHYTCANENCTQVKYFFYDYNSTTRMFSYILLENGKKVEDALKEMINYKTNQNEPNENVNVYSSAIKGYIDNWYKKNILGTASEKYLDLTAVYCNNRSVNVLGSWNKNGSSIASSLGFANDSNLACVNTTDRFSVRNMEANLTYPIALLTSSEINLMGPAYAASTSAASAMYSSYWTNSPDYFDRRAPFISGVSTNTSVAFSTGNPNVASQVRPAITLSPSALITEGDGGYETPYVVGPIVTR